MKIINLFPGSGPGIPSQTDLERGWSAVAGGDEDYLRELLEMGDDFEIVPAPDYWNCSHALKIDGLCGYGPFDDMDEAMEAAFELVEDAGEYWQEFPYVAFFSGEDAGWDEMAGDLFFPAEILKIKEF